MAEYFSFQAALCFSIAHIMIRRGLVDSNAMTGAFISLSMSAGILWVLLLFMIPLNGLMDSGCPLFRCRRYLCTGYRPDLELRRNRTNRCRALSPDRQLFADLRIDLRRSLSGRGLGRPKYHRHDISHLRCRDTIHGQTSATALAKKGCHLSHRWRRCLRYIVYSSKSGFGCGDDPCACGCSHGRNGSSAFLRSSTMPKRAASIQAHTKKRCLAISGRSF